MDTPESQQNTIPEKLLNSSNLKQLLNCGCFGDTGKIVVLR
jgi:hypothetical protein